MLAARAVKPTRVRDENENVKDDRPMKKPRVPVTSKSGLSTSTTMKRPVLSDVSNAKQEIAKKKPALVAVKSFNQATEAPTKRAALADVKNTTSSKLASGLNPTSKAISTAAGRVIMKAKRKAVTTTKVPTKQAKSSSSSIMAESKPVITKKVEPKMEEEKEPEEEEEEEEQPNKQASAKMDIEENVSDIAVNPPTTDDMSTDELSIDLGESATKKRPSLSELLAPMETLGMSADLDTSLDDKVEDIDSGDIDDPAQVIEYVNDIMELWREKEKSDRMPKQRYMKSQRELNFKMRGILVDWMLDVSVQFSLLAETQFLAVQLLDRLLSIKEVSKARIQLIGISALVIAAKFEETRVPCLDDFIWISADAFTREEVLRVEKIMLGALDWDLTLPTPLHFLRRFSKAARSDSVTHTLSKYLTELSLPEYKMLRFVPSMVAASAVYLARKMTNKTPVWNKTLQYYTQYAEEDLEECVELLNDCHGNPSDPKFFKAVVKKYANSALFSVSTAFPAVTSFSWQSS